NLAKDLGCVARALRRSPVFTAAAALTIALGIGASTAIFSVANAVLLRPLPYREPDRLALVYRSNPAGPLGNRNFYYSNAEYFDLHDETAPLFDEMGGVCLFRAFVPLADGSMEQIAKGLVTPNFFRLMGARIAVGRDFTDADAMPQPANADVLIPPGSVAILSHEYWQRRYGGDPAVLGQRMPGAPAGPVIVG